MDVRRASGTGFGNCAGYCRNVFGRFVEKSLAFRGGTALHKLYLKPQMRYSEDIDLVQINYEPINPILKRMRERLAFLGTKRTVKQHIHNNTVVYRFDSEMQPISNMRLKIGQ